MPIDIQNTTLAGAPYFDDFAHAEASNYHRVLFKPSVAVQARELNQLQSILQNQVERFGENIYQRGTIIKGCNVTYDANYYYVKVNDQQLNGQSVSVIEYANTLVESSDGLQAYVVNQVDGLISTAPDLNTLYVKYINSGTGTNPDGTTYDIKTFQANSTLTSFNRERTVERIEIVSPGTAYANTDTVVITANNDSGTGAKAILTTYSNGTIQSIAVTSKGSGYTNPPSVTIDTTTGTGAELQGIHYIGQLVVANNSFDPVGAGYAAYMTDGIVFQKGHFLKTGPQTAIISKYNTIADGYPNNAIIGFRTIESIANSYADDTLLDNASGSTNEMAPGADRLQLTPTLVTLTPDQATTDSEFLTLAEFQQGYPIRTQYETVFNSFSTELEKRTAEESGDYVIRPFSIYAEENKQLVGGSYVSNTTHYNTVVTPGVAYVQGKRIEFFNSVRIPSRKSTDTTIYRSQSINLNFGSYVYVNNLAGNGLNPINSSTITLYSTALQAANSTNYGGNIPTTTSSIGTAKLRGLEYDSGTVGTPTAQYRAYLYDVKMNSGKSFADVRSLGISSVAAADIVTSGNSSVQKAVLYDVSKDGLVFSVGVGAVKSINAASLIYRTSNTGVNFAATGNVQITYASSDTTFPYTPGTTLSTTEENDFIIIPTSTVATVNLATASATVTTSNVVTGTSTQFTKWFAVGDFISLANATNTVVKRVTQIESDVKLYTDTAYAAGMTGNVAISFQRYQPISLSGRSAARVIVNSSNTVTIDLGLTSISTTLASTLPAVVYYNAKVSNPPIRAKKIQKNVYVKVSTDATKTSPNGPWCLGIPDVHKITGVYVSSANGWSNTTTNYVNQFELDNGQRDNLYGLSYLKRAPGATITTAGSSLLIQLQAYYGHSDVSGGAYFAGPASYPVDDLNRSANTIAITTEEIEVFQSLRDGAVYDLRNSIDFRPVVANTANTLAVAVSTATIDPSNTEVLSVMPNYFPSPTKYMSADVEGYLSRIDKVLLTTGRTGVQVGGDVYVVEGTPSVTPSEPATPQGAMAIGLVSVAPYPSLDPVAASSANRSDLAVKTQTSAQQRRFTMKDIGDMEKRIQRLEYYSLLNRLESATKDATTNQRALNGFMVDSFENYNVANLADTEYNAFIDTTNGVLRPRVKAENIDLSLDTTTGSGTTNVVKTKELVLLPYQQKQLLKQPYATNERNLAGELWRFKGQLNVYPNYDGMYDKDVAPATITIDLTGVENTILDAIDKAFLLQDGKTTVTSVKTVHANRQDTTTVTGYIQKANVSGSGSTTSEVSSINVVSDVNFKPYIRSQKIVFLATGLRPNTRHYIFFDDVDVNSMTIPAIYNAKSSTIDSTTIIPSGVVGAELRSDSAGTLAGIFMLPEGTFFIGERKIKILDVSTLTSETAAVSFAYGRFVGYNVEVDHQQITFATKQLEKIDAKMVTTFSGVLSQTTVAACGGDPVAQTFKVPDDVQTATDGYYVTAIDIYFKSKTRATTGGVTIQLRNVVNGYPGLLGIPFSKKWVPYSDIAESSDGTQPTKFTFDSPVFLKSGEEYCITLTPDGNSPDFYIWTGQAGEPDVANPNLISKTEWGKGQMFTSVNSTAWNPHSFEDIKFTLYHADFTGESSGTAAFTHDSYEFMTLSNPTGNFTRGDVVAQKSASYVKGTLTTMTANVTNGFLVNGTGTTFTSSLNTGDNILITYGFDPSANLTGTVTADTSSANVTGSTTTFLTDLSVGDHVLIGSDIRKVLSVVDNTHIVMDAPLTAAATGSTYKKLTSVVYDITTVNEIVSDTSIKLAASPKYHYGMTIPTTNTLASTVLMKVVTGTIDRYRSNEQILYLKKSTASSSTNRFVKSSYDTITANSGRCIVCGLDTGVANVASVDNIGYQVITPSVTEIIPTGTATTRVYNSVKPSETALNNVTGGPLSTFMPFGAELRSRSNEINGTSVVPSFRMLENLTTGSAFVSPAIDSSPVMLEVLNHQIDNYTTFTRSATFSIGSFVMSVDTATGIVAGMGVRGLGLAHGTTVVSVSGNTVTLSKATLSTPPVATPVDFHPAETTRFGVSKNKYISKYMELADGMEAEDIKVYLTAYRPVGTDVDVYVKLIHSHDGEVITNKEWTLMQQTVASSTSYSDPINTTDYKELTYVLPKTPPAIKLTGRANTSSVSNTVTLDTTGLAQIEIAVGDIVKLVKGDSTLASGSLSIGREDDFDVRTVTAISSNTSFSIDSNPSFTLAGATVERVTQPRAAFRYNRTTPGYIGTYFGASTDGTLTAQYQGYKYAAVKIVLRATGSTTVPIVIDMRTIAVLV